MTEQMVKKDGGRFCRDFGLKYPIVLAPMFLVNTVELVSAAAEAGILGTFPAMNYREPDALRQAIREIKDRIGHARFGINIIVQSSNKRREEQMQIAMEEGVQLIITSLGNPKWFIEEAHAAGAKVYCDVVGLEHAQKAADLGADGLIAVSCGAGGHAGSTSPFVLLPMLAERLDLPILAAGAVSSGRTMAAAMTLGAEGVYMGTRFIASAEAQVPQAFKEAILRSGAEDIVNTDRVDGFPGNFIRDENLIRSGLKPGFIEYVLSYHPRFKRLYSLSRAAASLLGGASSKKMSYKTIWSAGQGVEFIDSVKPLAEIVETIISEYRSIVGERSGI